MDEVFGIGELVKEEIKMEKIAAYTAANLRGLKVEHNIVSLGCYIYYFYIIHLYMKYI